METARLGGLNCRIVGPDGVNDRAELIVVLCHGYGAPGTDLVPIGAELFHLHPGLKSKVQFIFPEAPLSLEAQGAPGGRAWWHLDVLRFMTLVETGEIRDLSNETPVGLDEARELLLGLLTDLQTSTGLPWSRFVLGGFSQGSMLSTDVALRLPETPGALCVMSGTLLCQDKWKNLAAGRGPLRVLQSHGLQDPILPYQGAELLRDLFMESGFEVDFVSFPGPHTIPFEVLHRFASLLGDLANGNRSSTQTGS